MCYLYWFVGCSVQCNMVCGGRVPMGMRYWGFPVLVSALRLFFTSHWWFLFIIISILIRIWERLCEYDMARTHIAYGMMPAGMFIVGRDVALWNGDLSSSLFICHNHNNNTFVPKHINSTSPSDNYLSGASIIFSHTHTFQVAKSSVKPASQQWPLENEVNNNEAYFSAYVNHPVNVPNNHLAHPKISYSKALHNCHTSDMSYAYQVVPDPGITRHHYRSTSVALVNFNVVGSLEASFLVLCFDHIFRMSMMYAWMPWSMSLKIDSWRISLTICLHAQRCLFNHGVFPNRHRPALFMQSMIQVHARRLVRDANKSMEMHFFRYSQRTQRDAVLHVIFLWISVG